MVHQSRIELGQPDHRQQLRRILTELTRLAHEENDLHSHVKDKLKLAATVVGEALDGVTTAGQARLIDHGEQ